MAEMYKKFVPLGVTCTFTEQDAQEVFTKESTGKGSLAHNVFGVPPYNGYWVGKHWMDITIGMWNEDLGKTLFRCELEGSYPKWFLAKVLG